MNIFAKWSAADILSGDGNTNLNKTKFSIGDVRVLLGKTIGLVTSTSSSSMTASKASSDL